METAESKSEPVLVTTHNASDLRPELMAAMRTYSATMKANRTLPERLVELMRLRIAFHNQCRTCMSVRYSSAVEDGLTEGLVCSLETPDEPSDMSAAERAAVRFGDKFASNHHAITAEDRLALCEHFSPGQIVELGMLAASFTGFGRFGAVFDAGHDLPVGDRKDDGSFLTPWGIAEPVVT